MLQLATPLLFFVVPALFLAYCVVVHLLLTLSMGAAVIGFVELYGFANALITIYVVKPYRRFVYETACSVVRCATRGRYGAATESGTQHMKTVSTTGISRTAANVYAHLSRRAVNPPPTPPCTAGRPLSKPWV